MIRRPLHDRASKWIRVRPLARPAVQRDQRIAVVAVLPQVARAHRCIGGDGVVAVLVIVHGPGAAAGGGEAVDGGTAGAHARAGPDRAGGAEGGGKVGRRSGGRHDCGAQFRGGHFGSDAFARRPELMSGGLGGRHLGEAIEGVRGGGFGA